MILETFGIGASLLAMKYYEKRHIRKLKNDWRTAMIHGNAVNHKKDSNGKADPQTFELLKVIEKEYGYDAIVSIPYGKSYDDLEKQKDVIETNLHCRLHMHWVRESGCGYARIVTKPFNYKEPYKLVKTDKPYELYVGTTYYKQPIISDMTKHPHVMISGASGAGKSFLMFIILTNLLNNNTADSVNLYLAQISDKQDLAMFKNVEHTKYYAENLEKATLMFRHIKKEMAKRNKLIYSVKGCNTLEEYNKKVDQNKQLPFIYVFADEFSYYMEDGTEKNNELNLKKECQSLLTDFVKQARSAGIFIIVGLQRPDKENTPPIFKSQINTRIAFRQNNTASSLVVVDSGEAATLLDREAIVLMGGQRYLIATEYITNRILRNEIKKYESKESHLIDMSNELHDEKIGKEKKHQKFDIKKIQLDSSDALPIKDTIKENQIPESKVKKGVIGSVSAKR